MSGATTSGATTAQTTAVRMDAPEPSLDEAFTRVVSEHQSALFSLARRLTASRGDAEDLTAETFLRAWRHVVTTGRLPPPGDETRAWLATVLLNVQRNRVRIDRRRPSEPRGQLPEPPVDPGRDEATAVARRTTLERAIDQLPQRQRVAVVLRHVLDLPTIRVAEVLGCSENAAPSHLSRGIATLRNQLEGDLP